MKETRYRVRFANGGLKKELDKCKNSCELYMLLVDYLEISHEESRIFRLINADVIIKDLKQDIEETIEKSIEVTPNMLKTGVVTRLIRSIVRIFAPML